MRTNVAASVRARLQNRAKDERRPFQELLQYYGLERFLFRLSRSSHRDQFILKGALMLRVWDATSSRPTRDIDFLAFTDNDIEAVKSIVVEICNQDSDDDGVIFDSATVTGERIKEDADYEGIRIKFIGFLERARIPMQIDIAFGDVMHPDAVNADYPTLLDTPAPMLRVYPRDTVIAEKFQAMVHLGTLNSRMKDFYDIWLVSRQFDFDGGSLADAVEGTFKNRETRIETEPVALTSDFSSSEDKQKQWTAFLRKSQIAGAPPTFGDVAIALREFLLPIARSLAESREFNSTWTPPGPWTEG